MTSDTLLKSRKNRLFYFEKPVKFHTSDEILESFLKGHKGECLSKQAKKKESYSKIVRYFLDVSILRNHSWEEK